MHLRTGVRFPPPPLRKYPESHAVGASHLRGVPRRFQSRDLRGYGSRARTTAPSSTDPSGSTQPAPHGKRQVGVLAFDAAPLTRRLRDRFRTRVEVSAASSP